jgi:ketosteroid isomerase-like protein
VTISNAEQARRGWEAVQRGDFDVITEMLDPDVKWHGGDPSAAGACQNRNQAVAFMKAAWAARPQAQLVDVREAGDKVVLVLRRGTNDAGQPELVANLTSFRDGKVVEMVHYEDPEDALAAAGLSG